VNALVQAEQPLTIAAPDGALIGILHPPAANPRAAVLIVVGGPQYRVGSHRQFVLLARHLAAEGCAVLRFDYGGMGDSDGDARTFENCDDHIRLAIDALLARAPQLEQVFLWGLCDAASAILMYAASDARVAGVVIANPWARSPESQAKTLLTSYYIRRLLSVDFWRSLFSGGVRVGQSVRELAENTRTSMGAGAAQQPFLQRMLAGAEQLARPMLLIISPRDLTAAEFLLTTEQSPAWQRALAKLNLTRRDVPAADHTFSRREWRDTVAQYTAEWILKR
jgi:exosortase A-associated hydrolase 1